MSLPATRKERDEALVDGLRSLGAEPIDVWRYFSDRADKFADQMWTTGTWLLGIVSLSLGLPFAAGFVSFGEDGSIVFDSRLFTILISLFGLAICVFGYVALRDIREHIEGNWRRSDLARTNHWKEATWGGRKLHGWIVLMIFGAGSAIAFLCLITLALFWR